MRKQFFSTTKVIFGDKARFSLQKGIKDVSKCTAVTLGPLVLRLDLQIIFLGEKRRP